MPKVNKSTKRTASADIIDTSTNKKQKVNTKPGHFTRPKWTGEEYNSTLKYSLFKRDLTAKEIPFKDGKLNGTVKKYFPEPVNNYVCDYVNGVKHGSEKRFELTDKDGLVTVYECKWNIDNKDGDEIYRYNYDTECFCDDVKYSCKWINGVKDGFEKGYFSSMLDLDIHNLPFSKYHFYTDWDKGVKTNSRVAKQGRHVIQVRLESSTVWNYFYFAKFKDGVPLSQELTHKDGWTLTVYGNHNSGRTFRYHKTNVMFEGVLTSEDVFTIVGFKFLNDHRFLSQISDKFLKEFSKLKIDFDYLNNIADHRDDPDVDIKLTNIYNSLVPSVPENEIIIK